MKTSKKTINSVLKKQIDTLFIQTITDLKDPEETKRFLTDFLSEVEFETLSKRLAISYWLKKGRSYQVIKENLKVSSSTISTVNSSLTRPGIAEALKKTEAEEWANKWSERIKQFVGSVK